jgi:lysyl-tRNA synthetase class 2
MTLAAGATLATLRARAALLGRLRDFFAAHRVLEVETPMLSPAAVSDPAIESIAAVPRALAARHYLHTSPEYAMKRLLAAGSGDIYQLCRVFRDDELGRWHQPEFTLLEWYRVGWDELELMSEVEHLLNTAVGAARAAVRVRYFDALAASLGCGPGASAEEIATALGRAGIDVPAGLTRDALLDLAFATAVAPRFDRSVWTFVHDYPASQAALARLKPGPPPVAARFEVFAGTIELANGFHELTDEAEQRQRFATDLATRRRMGKEAAPLDEELLAALPRLPPCAGVAVGVDRLLALAMGLDGVAPTMAFAHVRSP